MNDIIYTFIIPHRNNPILLNRCINSIPQRDDIQIIVIDDNSDFNKKPVKSERTDIEYIYINEEEAKGAGRARNCGIAKANGKWLLFADADDYYKDGFIDIIDKYKHSLYDIIYLNFEYRDGKTSELLPSLSFKKYFDLYDSTDVLRDEIRFHHNVPWTKMISKNYIDKYNLYFEEVPNGNDILFSMMAGYYTNNITVEKKSIYVYLKNENSILTTKKKSTKSHICKITHIIKLNQFYSFIGHSEWKHSIIKTILSHIKARGITLVKDLLISSVKIFNSRNEWIDIIKSR